VLVVAVLGDARLGALSGWVVTAQTLAFVGQMVRTREQREGGKESGRRDFSVVFALIPCAQVSPHLPEAMLWAVEAFSFLRSAALLSSALPSRSIVNFDISASQPGCGLAVLTFFDVFWATLALFGVNPCSTKRERSSPISCTLRSPLRWSWRQRLSMRC
jgi:hypothetical protein